MTNSKSVPCLPPADVDPTEAAVESLLPAPLLPLEPPVHPNAVWTRAGLEVAVDIRQCVVQSVLLQILQLLGPESLEVVHHEGQSAALAGARERPGRRPDGETEAVPAVEVAAVLQPHLLASRHPGVQRLRGERGLQSCNKDVQSVSAHLYSAAASNLPAQRLQTGGRWEAD